MEDDTVKGTIVAIKAVSIVQGLMETFMAYRVGLAYYAYHMRMTAVNEIAPRIFVPETAKIAAFIFLGVCALKFILAVANYKHASRRTDRTVESVNSHQQFMAKVSFVCVLASAAAIWGLNVHKKSLPESQSAAESVQKSVYVQIAVQLVGHYLMNSLHDQESKLSRIVDLRAHGAKL